MQSMKKTEVKLDRKKLYEVIQQCQNFQIEKQKKLNFYEKNKKPDSRLQSPELGNNQTLTPLEQFSSNQMSPGLRPNGKLNSRSNPNSALKVDPKSKCSFVTIDHFHGLDDNSMVSKMQNSIDVGCRKTID